MLQAVPTCRTASAAPRMPACAWKASTLAACCLAKAAGTQAAMGHGSATESVMTSSTDVVPRRATTTDLVPAAELGVCEAQLLQRCLAAGGNPIPLGELEV